MTDKERPDAATSGTDGDGGSVHSHHSTAHGARQGPAHGHIADGVWCKTAKASVHQLRRPPAWCLDKTDALAAWRAGAEYVAIRDLESGREHWARLQTLLESAALFDRGAGPQLLWPLSRWAASREQAQNTGGLQLALFGGRL